MNDATSKRFGIMKKTLVALAISTLALSSATSAQAQNTVPSVLAGTALTPTAVAGIAFGVLFVAVIIADDDDTTTTTTTTR